MKTTATIILNRNLPDPTDKLCEHLAKFDNEETDVYVLEAGSEINNLSQYCTCMQTMMKLKKRVCVTHEE